jgi:hypothetical protein
MSLRRHIDEIRHEDGAWPLWRWDRNIRYLAKSLLHIRGPRTAADAAHFAAVHRYLGESGLTRGGAEAMITAVGDLMWIRSGFDDCLSTAVRAALAGDVLFANLETPVDPLRPVPRLTYETLHYNAPPAYLEAFRGAASRRVFSLANNHALDQGADGLARTRAAVLRDEAHVCVGGPAAGHEVAAVDDPRIGVFGCTYGINHCVQDPPAGIPVLRFGSARHATDWERVAGLVAGARAAGPDLVVAMPHWGFEYEYWPDERVRGAARRLIELGGRRRARHVAPRAAAGRAGGDRRRRPALPDAGPTRRAAAHGPHRVLARQLPEHHADAGVPHRRGAAPRAAADPGCVERGERRGGADLLRAPRRPRTLARRRGRHRRRIRRARGGSRSCARDPRSRAGPVIRPERGVRRAAVTRERARRG